MGFMDSAKDKARKFLRDEEKTDRLLDRGEQFATDRLGADKAGHISRVREAADSRLGEENRNQPTPEQQADPGDLADPDQSSPDTPPAR